jgi:hypothetical protein
MTEFIFMLTHHDVTVSDALEILEKVRGTGLKYIGCKDIGLNTDQYVELFSRMKRYGMETFLEVVTYNKEEHLRGVDLALRIGADNLIGGMPSYTEMTSSYLRDKGKQVNFFPYIGKVVGHPCILEGNIEEIINDGKRSEVLGIDGINLLLYRYKGDQNELLEEAVKQLRVPLIVAGNVNNFDQIEELKKEEVWAFTIGGAIFEKKFVEDGDIENQIEAVLKRL